MIFYLVRLLEQLTTNLITVFCVHDSFIVADKQKHELLRAMGHACNQVIGRNIRSDYTKDGLFDGFEKSKQTQKEPKKPPRKIVRCEGYMRRMGLNPSDDFFDWQL